jgi:hypothetical protein
MDNMVNSLSRVEALAVCVCLQSMPAYCQCDSSVQRNDSLFTGASGARSLDGISSSPSKDIEISSRGGARVEVYLCDGSMMYGDLLSVRDGVLSVYVYKDHSFSPSHPPSSGPQIFVLRGIRKVVVKGRSKIFQGVFMGFLGGMIAGSIMTRFVERDIPAGSLFGPGAFGGMGLIMGGTIGYLSSGNDVEINKFDVNDINLLKTMCRNPENGTQ